MVDYVDFARVRELPEFATVDTVYFVQPNAGDPVRQFITGDDAVPVEIAAATAAQQLFDAGLIDTPTVGAMAAYLQGPSGTLEIGTVTTGPPGSAATVTNRGTPDAAVWDISLPRGTAGPGGAAATIAVGTVTTGAPGSAVIVTNAGTSSAAQLNFFIPRGADGKDADPIAVQVVADDLNLGANSAIRQAPAAAASLNGAADRANAAFAALLQSTLAVQGKTGTLTTGDPGGDQTWTLFTPVPTCGPGSIISAIDVYAVASGALIIRVFAKSGDTFTRVGNDTTVTMAAGLNSFTSANFTGIPIATGQYIGWYAADRIAIINNFGTDKYYVGPYLQNSTTFTSATPFANYTFQIRFTLQLKTLVDISTLGGGGPDRSGGVFRHQLNLIDSTGQSLSQGSTPNGVAITTAQEYDNVGFPALSTSPTALLPLTVANCQVTNRGEAPIFGALGHLKELILEENGLTYQANDFVMAGVTNGQDGGAFSTINKGTAPYNAGLSQIVSGKTIADASSKSFGFAATILTHGETDRDNGMSTATYLGLLKAFADDRATDARARTTQYVDPILLLGQMNSGYSRDVSYAQVQAANEHPLIYLAGPSYQFTYGDYQHRNAEGQKNYGGMVGLALKRILVDGVAWEPLQPVSHSIFGNVIDVVFNKDGLSIDTTLMPAQENYGFTLAGSNGAKINGAITGVQIIDSRRIRLTLASAATLGQRLRYGFDTMTGRADNFIGGGGNIRDNQGDRIKYRGLPVYNWLVIFDRPL